MNDAKTITIGGRALQVRPATLGMIKREILPRLAKLKAPPDQATIIDIIVEELLMYLGHNEGVNADWLLDNVPGDVARTLDVVRAAARAAERQSDEASPGLVATNR